MLRPGRRQDLVLAMILIMSCPMLDQKEGHPHLNLCRILCLLQETLLGNAKISHTLPTFIHLSFLEC